MCFPTEFPLPTVHVSPPSATVAKTLRKKALSACATSTKATPVKKANRVKRSVRFAEYASVVYRHASTTDLQHAWNQKQDIDNIKNGIRAAIQAVVSANGNLHEVDSSVHCFRGIEAGICPSIGKMKKMWAKTTTQNVVNEQRLQRNAGIVDPQRLREISLLASQEAVRCAAAMAELDAKQACC